MRYQFIADHLKIFSLAAMCRVMGVSRSGFYDWFDRPISAKAQHDQALKAEIAKIHHENHATYGVIRMKHELAKTNTVVSKRRISRLMKEEGLACKTKKKFKATTDSSHNKPVADNLLNREFERDCLNEVYVGDITYIPTREGWLYLSVFIDLCSRSVVGWSMDKRMTAELVTNSLEMAIWKRRPEQGLMVHTNPLFFSNF